MVAENRVEKFMQYFSAWKDQFENPPQSFEINMKGTAVYLDDIKLCDVSELDVTAMDFENGEFYPEDFYIPLVDHSVIRIHINWPFSSSPSIGYVHRNCVMYSAV